MCLYYLAVAQLFVSLSKNVLRYFTKAMNTPRWTTLKASTSVNECSIMSIVNLLQNIAGVN